MDHKDDERSFSEDRYRLVVSRAPQVASTFMTRVGPLAAGAAGLALGGASGVLRQLTNGLGGVHVDTLIGTTLTGIVALLIALPARRTHSQLGYQVRSAALWTGFTVGFALAFPMLADDVLGVGALLALASGLVGALIVSLPRAPGGWFRARRLARERKLERKREQGAMHPTEFRMGSAVVPSA